MYLGKSPSKRKKAEIRTKLSKSKKIKCCLYNKKVMLLIAYDINISIIYWSAQAVQVLSHLKIFVSTMSLIFFYPLPWNFSLAYFRFFNF